MPVIDPKKNYKTRDGREAVIVEVTGEEVIAVVKKDGDWAVIDYYPDGRYVYVAPHGLDLIEVLPEDFRYYNIMDSGYISLGQMSRADADELAEDDRYATRIACLKIDLNKVRGRFDD